MFNPATSLLFFLLCSFGFSLGMEFFVSTMGSDSNTGTSMQVKRIPHIRFSSPNLLQNAFATITRAQSAVRNFISTNSLEDVYVTIDGGSYPQYSNLSFGTLDGGNQDIFYRQHRTFDWK